MSQRLRAIRWASHVGVAMGLCGCGHRADIPATNRSVRPRAVEQRPLRLDAPREAREAEIVAYYRKPVMGRRSSLRDVERIVRDVTPILARAARQPEVQESLRALAGDMHESINAARATWVRLQEADILLESGGNPEDVSSANAVGVAQWIYETGTRAGLKVNLPESRRLTAVIDPLKRQVAWLDYLVSPGADPHAPGNPGIDSTQAGQWLPAAKAQLEDLRAKRRAIDERYDPERALFAHTRYLLGLYRKFPDLQWVFQAFHGGEAGVARTLARYMRPMWKGSPATAIRTGFGGRRLSYETLYFTVSPRSHAASFSYLYGRGDDHRHYWWKMRAAEQAFALYRRDPNAFRHTWESLLPGRAKEAMWRPDGPEIAFPSSAAIEKALGRGDLLPVAPIGLTLPPGPKPALRPPAAGLSGLICAVFCGAGGKPPLAVGETTLPLETLRARRPLQPNVPLLPPDSQLAALPGGGPPGNFDYHSTGWAFDLLRPADDLKRKTLEYALGYLRDRGMLWFMDEADRGARRYHVMPGPRFDDALAQIARSGHIPTIPELAAGRRAQRAVQSARLSRNRLQP